jgi:malate synthase
VDSEHEEDLEHEGDSECEEELDKEWALFVAKKKENGKKDLTVERFLRGQENWSEAHEKLETAHGDFQNKMCDKIEGLINLFNAVYKQKQAQLDELEAECKRYLIENHRRRNEALDTLRESNKKWKSNYEILIARTLDEDEPAMVDGSDDESGEVGFMMYRLMLFSGSQKASSSKTKPFLCCRRT